MRELNARVNEHSYCGVFACLVDASACLATGLVRICWLDCCPCQVIPTQSCGILYNRLGGWACWHMSLARGPAVVTEVLARPGDFVALTIKNLLPSTTYYYKCAHPRVCCGTGALMQL